MSQQNALKKPDLSHFSDDDLKKLAGISGPTSGGPDLSHLSDDELKALAFGVDKPQEPKGIIDTVADTYASYLQAPVRAGLSELTRTTPEFGKEEPSVLNNLAAAGKAFYNQFGEDPSKAPTGKDIAVSRIGLSDKPIIEGTPSFGAAKLGIAPESGITPQDVTRAKGVSPAGIAGLAIDVGADLGNVVPIGAVAKGIGKAGEVAAKSIGRFTLDVGKALPGGKNVIEGSTKVLNNWVGAPKIAEDFADLSATAAKHNIDMSKAPEAIEFGKDSYISRASRVATEGPLGQARLENAQKFQNDVTSAFDQQLSSISKGTPLPRVDAGIHLRESFDRATDELFNTVADTTYNKVVQSYPGLKLNEEATTALASKLDGIESFAKGQLKRGISDLERSQARGLINVVNAIRSTDGSVKQAVEELQAIGKAAYKPANTLAAIPPDIEKLREIYSTLRDGVYSTVKSDVKNGDALVESMKTSNELMSKFFGNRDAIGNILGNPKLAPEQVFDRILKNTAQVDALKNMLHPDDLARLKGSYLESIIKRDELGNISWKQLKNSLENRANKDVIARLFKPQELQELESIAKLGERAGIPIMSTSGTGASNSFREFIKDAPYRVGAESMIDIQKRRARGLAIPRDVSQPAASGPMFGPGAIGVKEAVGLRLPQQISIQQRNKEKGK